MVGNDGIIRIVEKEVSELIELLKNMHEHGRINISSATSSEESGFILDIEGHINMLQMIELLIQDYNQVRDSIEMKRGE